MQLSAVTKTAAVKGGSLDGAFALRCSPVESITLGHDGVWLFLKPNAEKEYVVNPDQVKKVHQILVVGPVPECFKYEQ